MRGNTPVGSRRGIFLVASCLLLGGCNDPVSQASAQTTQASAASAFDSSRLPRVA